MLRAKVLSLSLLVWIDSTLSFPKYCRVDVVADQYFFIGVRDRLALATATHAFMLRPYVKTLFETISGTYEDNDVGIRFQLGDLKVVMCDEHQKKLTPHLCSIDHESNFYANFLRDFTEVYEFEPVCLILYLTMKPLTRVDESGNLVRMFGYTQTPAESNWFAGLCAAKQHNDTYLNHVMVSALDLTQMPAVETLTSSELALAIAHEFGHAMSAKHDEDIGPNGCGEGYLMAGMGFGKHSMRANHTKRLSPCSRHDITMHIARVDMSGRSCLTDDDRQEELDAEFEERDADRAEAAEFLRRKQEL
ncbi:hypothetical protein AAVH_18126 [Aphelenchoides avenae]|nr:hypothetical protein AAVH_18126 [Aphelenchus avenae]